MLMKNLISAIVIFTSLTVYAHANDERWFQVEMLVFKNPTLETDNPEVWPVFAEIDHPDQYLRLEGVTDLSKQARLTDEAEALLEESIPEESIQVDVSENLRFTPFVALSAEERQLNDARETIESSRRYELLFHEAWNQPVPNRDNVISIRIDGGERFGKNAELQGYLDLYVERYLHLTADLHLIEYRRTSDPFDLLVSENTANASSNINTFGGISLLPGNRQGNSQFSRLSNDFYVSVQSANLFERRRMRSGEIHYLDNPKFGLIVLITPIQLSSTSQ